MALILHAQPSEGTSMWDLNKSSEHVRKYTDSISHENKSRWFANEWRVSIAGGLCTVCQDIAIIYPSHNLVTNSKTKACPATLGYMSLAIKIPPTPCGLTSRHPFRASNSIQLTNIEPTEPIQNLKVQQPAGYKTVVDHAR